ncbi:hypothetical protein PCANC_13690 [Puccinia coronata f. sp. avenae]|uniref:Uncharacterized protein n=1 Tax=Puccinia coronata f. sp. avenae TaxID=200324 RepID=A0A2N5SQ74_9BASI|nr:hypothetical protein PCANC_13690 [Puccinia coronata f. sp. avenae]
MGLAGQAEAILGPIADAFDLEGELGKARTTCSKRLFDALLDQLGVPVEGKQLLLLVEQHHRTPQGDTRRRGFWLARKRADLEVERPGYRARVLRPKTRG